MPIDLGDSVTRSIALTNAAGAAVDADSTPTYAVTLPAGTAGTPPTVQHGVTGDYYVVYPTTVAGRHTELWTAIVGGTPVVIDRNFTVEERGTAFVDTDEALAHLRAQGVIVTPADMEQLRWLCQVASTAVEDDLGRAICRRTITDLFNGGRNWLKLRTQPTLSITTVVENGITLTASDYVFDPTVGVLWRGTPVTPRYWYPALQLISVTYAVGMPIPPRVARKVALNAIERMWAHSQQSAHPAFDEIAAEAVIPSAVLTPVELSAYEQLRIDGMA